MLIYYILHSIYIYIYESVFMFVNSVLVIIEFGKICNAVNSNVDFLIIVHIK